MDLSAYAGMQLLFRFYSRTDGSVPGDGFYFDEFAVLEYTDEGGTTSVPSGTGAPFSFRLHQNYPNPFNPASEIRFDVPDAGFVTLRVFDLLGEEVATLVEDELPAGTHSVRWDARNEPSGVYFYRLTAAGFTQTRKLVLLR